MFIRAKKYLTIQMLATLEPPKVQRISEQKALRAFIAAASRVPSYRQFLKDRNLNPASIKTIHDFKTRVPILDKDRTFRACANTIQELCLMGETKDVKMIIASSGHSSCFSYGLNTALELREAEEAMDFMLDYIFEAGSKKTLLVNCLAMGIKINTSLASVTVTETSVRTDVVIGILKTFAPRYHQIILIGENSFIKNVLEEGTKHGVPWKTMRVHLVLGEETLPENLRSYFAGILGIDPDASQPSQLIGSSLGVAEFGLNLFYETSELIRLRRLLQRNDKLRAALLGREDHNLPALFFYNPWRVYVEELPVAGGPPQIVLTNLSTQTRIPLVRYNIKDEGVCLSFPRLKEILETFHCKDYLPRVRLPLVAIWGRDKILLENNDTLRPEFIKELLYEDPRIAAAITGYFRLSPGKTGGLKIEIQASEGTPLSQTLEQDIRTTLSRRLSSKPEIVFYPYRDFPYGMRLDYERKFQYI